MKVLNANPSFVNTNDQQIRASFLDHLKYSYVSAETRIIEEFTVPVGTSRVDLVVVDGLLHGYEIKSDVDTLYRLPDQIKAYNAVFDKVTLITGRSHLIKSFYLIPDWWGVKIAKFSELDQTVKFISIREPEENPLRDSFSIAMLLWRQEALDILVELNQAKGFLSKSREVICKHLANLLDQYVLRTEVRKCLQTRVYSPNHLT